MNSLRYQKNRNMKFGLKINILEWKTGIKLKIYNIKWRIKIHQQHATQGKQWLMDITRLMWRYVYWKKCQMQKMSFVIILGKHSAFVVIFDILSNWTFVVCRITVTFVVILDILSQYASIIVFDILSN